MVIVTALWLTLTSSSALTKTKKLYCWDEQGKRTCSDTLPPEAVNEAHDVFNSNSGLRSAEVQRSLSPEERAAIAASQAQHQADQAAEQTRQRTDKAMLSSYENEDDLRRVFTDRSTLIENNIATARFNATSIREGLVILLKNAGSEELNKQRVSDKATRQILDRHLALLAQQRLRTNFEQQRASLDTEIEQTLKRYRELKDQSSSPQPPG